MVKYIFSFFFVFNIVSAATLNPDAKIADGDTSDVKAVVEQYSGPETYGPIAATATPNTLCHLEYEREIGKERNKKTFKVANHGQLARANTAAYAKNPIRPIRELQNYGLEHYINPDGSRVAGDKNSWVGWKAGQNETGLNEKYGAPDVWRKVQCGTVRLKDMIFVIIDWIDWLLMLAGSIAVIFIIVGGWQYLIGGLTDDKEKGKKTLLYACGGLAVALMSSFIINAVMIYFTNPNYEQNTTSENKPTAEALVKTHV